MGGVVSEVGEIGQGIISGVDEGLTQLDDAIPQEANKPLDAACSCAIFSSVCCAVISPAVVTAEGMADGVTGGVTVGVVAVGNDVGI